MVTGLQFEIRQFLKRMGRANGHNPQAVGEASAISVKEERKTLF